MCFYLWLLLLMWKAWSLSYKENSTKSPGFTWETDGTEKRALHVQGAEPGWRVLHSSLIITDCWYLIRDCRLTFFGYIYETNLARKKSSVIFSQVNVIMKHSGKNVILFFSLYKGLLKTYSEKQQTSRKWEKWGMFSTSYQNILLIRNRKYSHKQL